MNFITSLLPNKYRNTIYNIIFIIIDRFIKIIRYIFIIIKIDTI
jgi:hypothetical protein